MTPTIRMQIPRMKNFTIVFWLIAFKKDLLPSSVKKTRLRRKLGYIRDITDNASIPMIAMETIGTVKPMPAIRTPREITDKNAIKNTLILDHLSLN